MRLMLGSLILLILCCAPQLAAAQAATQDAATQNYAAQLKDYDQRMEDRKKLLADEAQQRSSYLTPLMIALGACVAFLLYTVVRGIRLTSEFRRRADETRQSIAESHRQTAHAIEQNARMIQLLESIDHKMNPPPG